MTVPRNAISLLLSLLLLALPGCAHVKKLFEPSLEKKDIDAAVERKDKELLRAACNGEKSLWAVSKKYVCRQLEEIELYEAGEATDCNTAVDHYKNARHPTFAYLRLMARKFADCGHYTELFEIGLDVGDTRSDVGKRILVELDGAGLPVHEKWLEYVGAHQGAQFFAIEQEQVVARALWFIGLWLLEKGHTGDCAAVAQAATGASVAARAGVRHFLQKSGCAEGVPIFVSLLLSDDRYDRIDACNALAEVGDASVIAKLETLATTDGYSERGPGPGQTIYPVRDACNQAVGKIKLRTAP